MTWDSLFLHKNALEFRFADLSKIDDQLMSDLLHVFVRVDQRVRCVLKLLCQFVKKILRIFHVQMKCRKSQHSRQPFDRVTEDRCVGIIAVADVLVIEKFVASFFGLSGSGKSTLTHATHNNKYEEIQVLHDDAFIINTETGASIAMEPTYFDKTADYPTGCPDNKYLLTAQNCSATRDSEGKVVLVTEDIRNGNGRAIKSKLWSPNRVDKINDPVNAIFWIMKDPTIPPIVKIKGASLASVMGATLATKRSSAERLAPGVDPNRLVVEPYANPFRTYPLVNDYKKFRKLVKERNVDCYIINTGDFMGKDIKPATTISAIEQVVEGTGEFKQWGPFTDIEVLEMEGYVSDL